MSNQLNPEPPAVETEEQFEEQDVYQHEGIPLKPEEDVPNVNEQEPSVETTETPPGSEPSKEDKKVIQFDQDALKELIASVRGPSQDQAPAKMTQEEIDAILKPVRVTEESLKALGFEEPTKEQIAGMQALLDAAVTHATNINRVYTEYKLRNLTEALTPIQQAYIEQQREATFNRFFSEYEALRPYKGLVEATAAQLLQAQPELSKLSEKEVFKVVASQTAQILSQGGLKIDLSKKAQATHSAGGTQRAVPKMQSLSPSGRSPGNPGGTRIVENADADIYR
mgnify:CR=1 FL=1